jgi:hypothetical protein
LNIDLTGNVADMGDDDIGVPAPNLQSRQFKAVLRDAKGRQARDLEGEDMARMAGYGLGSAEELEAHLHSHHHGGGVKNPTQSHMNYHLQELHPPRPHAH